MKKTLAMLLAVVMVLSVFAGCAPKAPVDTTPSTQAPSVPDTTAAPQRELVQFEGDYTYNDYVATLATNWNPHTYETNDDSYPMDFLSNGFYSFFFNDELNPVEGKEPYAGYVIVPEMAAAMPVDVTEQVKADHPEFGIPESATSGFAYTIDLNQAACWQDGTPITATDWVESYKRLLDPRLNNYRAGNYYESSFTIVGSEYYANAGKSVKRSNSSDGESLIFTLADLVKGEDGVYTTADGAVTYIGLKTGYGWMSGSSLAKYAGYFPEGVFEALSAMADEDGFVPMTDEALATLFEFTGSDVWGNETEEQLMYYVSYDFTYPEADYSTVGLYESGEYQLTLVLGKAMAGFNLLYNLGSSWLVKTDLYDSCIKETTTAGGTVFTCTYNSSVETTCSYGPYIMDNYQTDKAMHFVRNDNWYGYSDGKHVYVDPTDGELYPMYQTTAIDTQVVSEKDTAKMMFLKGQLMTYPLGEEDFATYRNSEFCHFTPGLTIFFIILNGNMEAIQEREAAGDFDQSAYDLEILTLESFHRAMGLTYDKALWCENNSPANSPAIGLIGNGYIYDPDTGARYRDTEQAMKVMCEVYGVNPDDFDSLADAVDSITGYDPIAAKEWYQKAFEEGLELGYITDENGDGICDQTIRILYANGSTEGISDRLIKRMDYLSDKANEVTAGTPFEGRIKFEPSAALGNDWSTKLKAGLVDTCLAGWTGGAMDPYGLVEVYTNPSYQYDAAWWDATSVDMTLTVPVDGVDTEITMNLSDWQLALNGTTISVKGAEYNFGEGIADVDTRLNILAGIEKHVLLAYNYLPFAEDGSMALLSQKAFYIVEEYNQVMGRGGIPYLRYNYNDAEWDAFVKEQNGELSY